VRIFVKDSARLLAEIAQAIAKNDAAGLQTSEHTLKGSAANFLAPPTVEAAYQLEVMGRDRNLSEAVAGLDRLRKEMAELTGFLTSIAGIKR
jgi:HPt (histidine-containing phosphotransfer) domain-containing protein